MDAVHVLFNKMNQQEIDAEAIENTNIMKFLYHCASFEKLQLNDVLKEIAQQESVSKILDYAKEIEPSVDLLKTLTLFFIYRNQYKNGFRYEEKWKLKSKQQLEKQLQQNQLQQKSHQQRRLQRRQQLSQ